MPIFRFIVSRLMQTLLVLLGTATVLFVVLYLLVPGDAAQVMLGGRATPQALANLRNDLGLNRPLWTQYGLYMWRLLHFDLGTSYELRQSVSSAIIQRLPATAYLAGAALLLEAIAGIGWGLLMALRRSSRLEAVSAATGAVLLSIPVFFLGLLLQYFLAGRLHLLPISGLAGWNPLNLILPATALAGAQAAIVAAVTRASLRAEMGKPYILAARARGLSRRQVMWKHALRNAIGPAATLLAIDLGTLMGGAMITEVIFSWPGLGRMTYFAVRERDVPLVTGIVLVLVTIFIVINSLIDIVYGILDPRIRTSESADA
ncbi:MAG: ABC transporter permease [Thermoleophilia bacterium]